MSEFQIAFTLKSKKIQKSFSNDAQLYELYVLCSKEFKCGMFLLKYDNINLNFLNKTIKLNTILNKKTIIHDMIIYQLPMPQQSLIKSKPSNCDTDDEEEENIITFSKGALSNLIQSKETTHSINKLIISSLSHSHSSEVSTFLLYFANMKLKHLKFSIQQLIILDSLNSQYQMPLVTELKELSIYDNEINNEKNYDQESSLRYASIKHLNLRNLKVIRFDNVMIEFDKPLISLQKIVNHNSLCLTRGVDYSLISSIDLSYERYNDIVYHLTFLDKQIKTNLHMLRITYDSIDLNYSLDLQKFITHPMMLKASNICLKLKAKFKAVNTQDTNNELIQSFNQVLGNIIELKLCPYNQFNEKDLEVFKGKLNKLVLFKLKNHNITNTDYFNTFFASNTSDFLAYIDVDAISEDYSDKIYKVQSFNKPFDSKFFPLLSYEKITKIILPYIEYNKKMNEIILLGDMIPSESENIEPFYIFIKQLLYSLDIISHLTIKSFNQSNSIFLNKVLMCLLNVISSPKLKQITLSKMIIDQSLIDKFSYIFVNSSSTLSKICLDELTFLNKDIEYLFYSIVFQVDYLQLDTLSMKNMTIDDSSSLILNESNLFEQISYVAFESIERFDYLEPILLETTLKGIELRNIDITIESLQYILKKNKDRLESIYLDLNIDIIDQLQNYSFVNLKELKLLSGCMPIQTKKCALFLKRRSWHFSRLNHLVTGEITTDMEKIIPLYKYLPMISKYR